MNAHRWIRRSSVTAAVAAAFAGALLLAGCNGSGGGTGQISMGVTDTPVDSAKQVVVAFTGVELHGPNGTIKEEFASEKTVDLLSLQGDASMQLLNDVTVDAGEYEWIRLDLDLSNSFIVLDDGTQYPLQVPSGSQTGLKLVSGFTVAQGSKTDFMIDFDLRKSLTRTSNPSTGQVTYILKPALRLINMQQVGSIAGTASANLTIGGTPISDSSCSPAVYIYDGSSVTPEGFNVTVDGGTPPLTSATLTLNSTTGNYDYKEGFLAVGTYSLAVTCAANDTTSSTAALAFSPVKTTTVEAASTSIVNFP